jgi:Superinfection immunity protein
MELVLLLLISLAVYFFPSFIASKRGHPQYSAIFVLNLLLGWTFIGWVAALVWSLTSAAMKHDAFVASVRSPVLQTAIDFTAARQDADEPTSIKRGLYNLDHAQEPDKPQTPNRWQALTRYDPEIRAAVEELRPFGVAWVDKLGRDFFALNEDKSYLPKIIEKLKEEAQQAPVFDREEWNGQFRRTADGELCSEESLRVLHTAKVSGYTLSTQRDGTFVLKKGTSAFSLSVCPKSS